MSDRDRRYDAVDLADPEPGTVRRSEGGFTEPLPAPERAQDGDMSIPELDHQDPRYEVTDEDGEPGPHSKPSPGPGRRVRLVLDASEDSPWADVEKAAQTELTKELRAASDHANRAAKWAKILADVDDETTEALRYHAERLRLLRDDVAKGPR